MLSDLHQIKGVQNPVVSFRQSIDWFDQTPFRFQAPPQKMKAMIDADFLFRAVPGRIAAISIDL